jgi:prephenate dehydrogenase
LGETRLAILGLGLMGGSLALALRGKCARLLGMDQDAATLALAAQTGLVDKLSANPAEILAEADLIVLAMPVRAILAFLQDLPNLHPGPAVVLDLGSTKAAIAAAMARLPARFNPIGGHPMCGKERSGLALADPGLYEQAPFALTPLPRTTPGGRGLAEALVRAAGARPVWVDAETHDLWVAATSHLPYLLACALAAATPEEAAPLIGPGYRGASRLSVSPVEMMMDILSTNRAPVLAAVSRMRSELEGIEACLEKMPDSWNILARRLAAAAGRQAHLLDAQATAWDAQAAGWDAQADSGGSMASPGQREVKP